MLIDLTLELTPELIAASESGRHKAPAGHLGTHFDVMDCVFPLDYTSRAGVVFDVQKIGTSRDIEISDIDLSLVKKDMFVGFSVGFLDALGYNHEQYFRAHPQLSVELIDALLDRGISIIGLDFAGVRHDPAHTPMDQHCADHGVFIVENLCGFQQILKGNDHAFFTANTYPVRASGITGLPCRVIASV